MYKTNNVKCNATNTKWEQCVTQLTTTVVTM